MVDMLAKRQTSRNPVDSPSPNGHAASTVLGDTMPVSVPLAPQICQPAPSPLMTSSLAFPSTSKKFPATSTTWLTTASGTMELISAAVRPTVLQLLFVGLLKRRPPRGQLPISQSCKFLRYD